MINKKLYKKKHLYYKGLYKKNTNIRNFFFRLIKKGFSLKHIYRMFKSRNNKNLYLLLLKYKFELLNNARKLKSNKTRKYLFYIRNLRRKFHNHLLTNKSYYINFIYQKLFSLLFIFILIIIRWIYKNMNRVVFSLWAAYFLFKFNKDYIECFYKYIFSYKNNYIFIYDKNIIFSIHLAIPRYLINLEGCKLFRLDSNSANKIIYTVRRNRKSKYIYIAFVRGKVKSRTRIFWKEKKPFFHLPCFL